MSTPSLAAKPVPETLTDEVGGPLVGESTTGGVAVELLVSLPSPHPS
jgi:hypothetical protein